VIPAGIGAVAGLIKAGADKTTEYCKNSAQSYEDEAQQIRTEAETQKVKENNQ